MAVLSFSVSLFLKGLQAMQAFVWEEDLMGAAKLVTRACVEQMTEWVHTSHQPGVAGRDVI